MQHVVNVYVDIGGRLVILGVMMGDVIMQYQKLDFVRVVEHCYGYHGNEFHHRVDAVGMGVEYFGLQSGHLQC